MPASSRRSREGRQTQIDGLPVEIVRKPITRLRLAILPPDGRIRVSVPHGVPEAVVRAFVTEHRDWIVEKRGVVVARARLRTPEMVEGATHHVWGERRILRVRERPGRPSVVADDAGGLVLCVAPGTSPEGRRAALERWQRAELEAAIPALIARWEPVVGRQVAEWRIRKMRTRWGSCNPRARRIWLSLELASRPPECLEYVLVHEMVHLLEASHDARFYRLMDGFMPDWRRHRATLNAASAGDVG